MLFKIASYLLGTSNETLKTEEQTTNQEIKNTQRDSNLELINQTINKNSQSIQNLPSNQKDNVHNDEQEDQESVYIMYAERLVNSSNLIENNLEDEFLAHSSDHSNDLNNLQNQDLDDEDQWIYIEPIKCKNKKQLLLNKTNEELDEQNSSFTENACNVSKKIQFNFYDYFNNTIGKQKTQTQQDRCSSSSLISKSNTSIRTTNTSSKLSKNSSNPSNSSNLSNLPNILSKNLNNHENPFYMNKLEDSWVIHPPACFQLDNTFSIEEHPLENLYIENPALSVFASIKFDKENTTEQTKENKLVKSITKKKSVRSKRSRKQEKNRKSSAKTKNSSSENVDTNKNQKQQALKDKQAKQLIAHYLNMNSNTLDNLNPQILNGVLTSNATCSTVTSNAGGDHLFGSKSLKRNNKVLLQRKNLVNKPFKLHRKLC